MEAFSNPEVWISLLTLTVLEVVLGIDNLVFISILADKLPAKDEPKARQVGLALALITRILLLMSLSWLISLTEPWFSVFGKSISGRDLILLVGGLFLLGKSTYEIHHKLEGEHGEKSSDDSKVTFSGVIIQIMILDMVFSLDSVITAVGMVDELWIMVTAVIIAIIIMLYSVNTISDFVNDHPTIKMLALSFLLLIGFSLVAEGLGEHIEKGYIYFAMGFSVFVEFLNLRVKDKSNKPIELRSAYVQEEDTN